MCSACVFVYLFSIFSWGSQCYASRARLQSRLVRFASLWMSSMHVALPLMHSETCLIALVYWTSIGCKSNLAINYCTHNNFLTKYMYLHITYVYLQFLILSRSIFLAPSLSLSFYMSISLSSEITPCVIFSHSIYILVLKMCNISFIKYLRGHREVPRGPGIGGGGRLFVNNVLPLRCFVCSEPSDASRCILLEFS